ncbi:hypothetical protein OAJ61_01570 [bacterium]|nr:hypothetical protein [bacterium]
MTTEKWLKEEASWQLGKIIDALNSAHNMPFHCAWLERDLAMNYLEMLKGMESLLLLIWSQLKNISISKIEHQVMVWDARQKRSQKNILSCYYRHQEYLSEWANTPEVKLYGLSGNWSDYMLFVMTFEKNLLTKASSGKIRMSARDRESIAILFLRKMQMIYNAEPHQLCIDFFTYISPFTQESVSLPYRDDFDQKQTVFGTFNKFQEELPQSDKWSALCGMYLDVLDEIARENNGQHLE